MLRAPFWPAKLMWLRRTQPALFRRAKFWISPADWILEKLFGTNGTSASMASGTGLLNIDQQTWDEELSSLTGIEPKSLGAFETGTQATRGLPGVTVFTAIGDGAASNVGCGADRAGVFAINVGTSAAVRTICSRGAASTPFGLFRYVLDEKADVIGGAVSNAGNLRRWCVRELQLGDDRAVERALDRARAANNPLSVIPHWVQERAPDWPHDTGAVISGVRQSTTASDIFAAATCGVFYRLATIVDLLEKPFGRAGEIILSGGILRSPASLRLLSDCLGRDIRICSEMESSLRGAAIYALRRLGLDPKPLPRGALVRCRVALAKKHRARRAR
jgi:gluconokinase